MVMEDIVFGAIHLSSSLLRKKLYCAICAYFAWTKTFKENRIGKRGEMGKEERKCDEVSCDVCRSRVLRSGEGIFQKT